MDFIGFTIIAIYFVCLLAIGYYFSHRQQNLSDFFLAGHSIPTWAALAAVVATETSAVTYIGAPASSFLEDFSFLQFAFGFVLARFILAAFFLPRFFEHEIVTIYQYLGRQFGNKTQRVGGIFFFITRASLQSYYAAALVISSITRIDITTAILITGLSPLYSSWVITAIWNRAPSLPMRSLAAFLPSSISYFSPPAVGSRSSPLPASIINSPSFIGTGAAGRFPIPCSSASSVDSVPALPPTALIRIPSSACCPAVTCAVPKPPLSAAASWFFSSSPFI